MAETVKQYVRRILGYVEGHDPLAVQQATPRRLARLIRGRSRAQLARRPAPGRWSVAEVLAHLAESEMVAGYRLRMILSANGTAIQAFDQDKWAKVGKYARQDPKQSLEMFSTLRRSNLALLRSLQPRQWRMYGIHSERGRETVARIATMFAGHDINHTRQIEKVLRG
ncbi:MAG TPA: DinB family protein [Terriglobales bacterium]|nr:DinB family protein [Terriglobales bacterium]